MTGGSGFAGILIQARNTVPDSGLVTVSKVVVEENDVSDTDRGIYLLALASQPLPPFDPITGANALPKKVKVEENKVDDSGIYGIRVLGFGGNGTGTIKRCKLEENEVSNTGDIGIYLQVIGEGSDVTKCKVEENEVSGSVNFDLVDEGTNNRFEENECTTSSPAGLCEED